MSSEQAASAAVVATCGGGGTITTLVSTNTIVTTLPWIIKTFYKEFEYTSLESDGTRLTTSRTVLTVPVRTTPTETKTESVTFTSCIGAALTTPTASTTPSTPSSIVSAPTTMATPPAETPNTQSGDDKTLLITATVGSISFVFILITALSFWVRRRAQKKKLELVSHKDLTEAANFSFLPGGRTHRKFSIGSASANPTLVDYVGLMPSVSQRNLARPPTDVQSAVDTDWSNIQRTSLDHRPGRVHGSNGQYVRSERVPRRPSRSQHSYTTNYISSYSRDGSRAVPQIPAAESYTSRGTSAFLRPTTGVRTQSRETSYSPSHEHILLPTVYSPDSVKSAVPVPFKERDDEIPLSQPDPDDQLPRSPRREWAWAEALRRLEGIHKRRPVDFTTRDPTGDSQVTVTQNEFCRQRDEVSAMSDEGEYETIMYESDGESRAQSGRGPGRNNTGESVFSMDAVVRRIANEPPRERAMR